MFKNHYTDRYYYYYCIIIIIIIIIMVIFITTIISFINILSVLCIYDYTKILS